MDKVDYKLRTGLINQWDELTLCIKRLNNSCAIIPGSGIDVFKHVKSTDSASEFQLRPVLFVIPERANDTKNELHVVVQGRISLDRKHYEQDGVLRTIEFGTEAGYFRLEGVTLKHVYGAHYDFEKDFLDHPVFHVHMESFVELSNVIKDHYELEDIEIVDGMKFVLKTVRLPSAQMDAFSLFLQLVADHLLWEKSSIAHREQFGDLLAKSKDLQGAGAYVERLQVAPAIHCYRSVHWYPPAS
jgi:hypothetical protein